MKCTLKGMRMNTRTDMFNLLIEKVQVIDLSLKIEENVLVLFILFNI